MDDHNPPRSGIVRWGRGLALVAMTGGYVALVRANDVEASAIFAAGGDAGMWGVGLVFATALLLPGVVLALLSLAIGPRDGSAPVAVAAGLALLVPTAWLAANLYPPDKVTDEGSPLSPVRWGQAADLYLVAFVLMGAAGAILLVTALAGSARRAP